MSEQEITDFRISEAIRLIESKFDQDFDFESLAETLNLSSSRLRHLFKEQTGISFRKYLRNVRIKQAKLLLETGFLNIKETAHAVGIPDSRNFVRDFEKQFGTSPGKYRKNYRSAHNKSAKEKSISRA
jgi:transcriptional regulator GlxA family with amidase domain